MTKKCASSFSGTPLAGYLRTFGVAWNLYDSDKKFADVESVETCMNYSTNVGGWHNASTLLR